MADVLVEEEVAAEVDAVWALVRDFGGVKKWSPELTSVEVDGEGVGAVRTIETAGITIKERLEILDDDAKSFTYTIVEGPIPASDYRATLAVSAAGAGRSTVRWSSSFQPGEGAKAEDLIGLFEGVYKGGIAGLRGALGI